MAGIENVTGMIIAQKGELLGYRAIRIVNGAVKRSFTNPYATLKQAAKILREQYPNDCINFISREDNLVKKFGAQYAKVITKLCNRWGITFHK